MRTDKEYDVVLNALADLVFESSPDPTNHRSLRRAVQILRVDGIYIDPGFQDSRYKAITRDYSERAREVARALRGRLSKQIDQGLFEEASGGHDQHDRP